MIRIKVLMTVSLLALASCGKDESACVDEILEDVEMAMSVLPQLTSTSAEEKRRIEDRLWSVRSTAILMNSDEYRDACDYYLQGDRLALK